MQGRLCLGVVSAAVILTAALILLVDNIHGTNGSSVVYDAVTDTFFAFTGIACVVVLAFLITMIRAMFTDELNQEMKRLIVSQSTFVATFVIRVILIYLVLFGYWVDFTRDYPEAMASLGLFRTAMFPLQFIIYNIVPYVTITYIHHSNFKPKEE